MLTKTAKTLVDYIQKADSSIRTMPSKEDVVSIFRDKYNVKAEEHLLDSGSFNNLLHVSIDQKPDSIKRLDKLISVLNNSSADKNYIAGLQSIRDKVSNKMDHHSIFIDKKYEDSVPMLAHEYGHAMNFSNKLLANNRNFRDKQILPYVPYILGNAVHAAGVLANNKPLSIAGNTIRATASAPELVDEYFASKNARKALSEAGMTERPKSLDLAFGTHVGRQLVNQGAMYLLSKGVGTLARKVLI